MRLRALGVLTLATLLLAACSDDEPSGNGLPNTEPTVDGEPTVDVPTGDPSGVPTDAPKVANPVTNVDKYKSSPCDMLTKQQATDLGFDAKIGREASADLGPACEWQNDNGDNISIVLHSKQPLGIAGIYRNKAQFPDQYAYFEPIDLGGFPGVFAAPIDGRADGSCQLAVGVTDQQVIVLTDQVDDTAGAGDVCDIIKRAGEAAVATMSNG